jgi:formylglycine-generating enzyme required for sulfatase activity
MRHVLYSLLLILAAQWAAGMTAFAEPRVALVIGNSKYSGDLPRLTNPDNDAELMAATLKKLGFIVVKVQDADLNQMKRAISDFGTKLGNAGPTAVGLFFYAGHGLQISGDNYLIPINARIEKAADADLEAVDANLILKQMEFAGNSLNILILDACRNNPLSRGMRSAGGGLAKMDAPLGTFIAYSTAPGETAADGNGKNSPYTAALTKAMQKPGIAIEEAFRDARIDVLNATERQQIPWESSSLTGAFFFAPGAPQAGSAPALQASVAPAAPAAPAQPSSATRTPAPTGAVKACQDCPAMVAIPAGSFMMGSPSSETGRGDNEGPQTKISLRGFSIGKYAVTRGQFAEFIKATGHKPARRCFADLGGSGNFQDSASANWTNTGFPQSDRDPVVCISWSDAKAYTDWLAAGSGKPYRLPSEAEWEYAARAGESHGDYWGGDPSDSCGYVDTADRSTKSKYSGWNVVDCDDGHAFTAPVGSYKPNKFGLFDMLGNAKQWVADCSSESLSELPTDGSANGGGNDCDEHEVRGSGWDGIPSIVRFAKRESHGSNYAAMNYGFRVALGQ